MRRIIAIAMLAVAVSSCNNISTEEKFIVQSIEWAKDGYQMHIIPCEYHLFRRDMYVYTKSVYRTGDTVTINLKRQ